MITDDLLYQLSLCDVPHIGHVHAKILCEQFGTAAAIFRAPQRALERIDGIGEARAKSIKRFRDFKKAEREIGFITKYGIMPLFFTDQRYPKRLLHCYDPPVLLFYKGTGDMNASRVISVVGTRSHSEYGRTFTERLVAALADREVMVVSGLAMGIDSCAHRSALKHGVTTIGVVGHGLDTIYPVENTALAKAMLANGGLLTEFSSNTKPDKHHFPSRNRIVAGMSDATVIIESGIRGGSMITAEMAVGYHRDLFAVPGRTTDGKSTGCNHLIATNRAALLQDPAQLIEALGWNDEKKPRVGRQAQLFTPLDDNQASVVNWLRQHGVAAVDDLSLAVQCSRSTLASTLLYLEMNHVVKSLPGQRYSLL